MAMRQNVVERSAETLDADDRPVQSARRPHRRWRRVLAVTALTILLLVAAVAGTLFALSERVADNVVRLTNVFGPLDPAARPAATGALTFLIVGTDGSAPDAGTGGPRGDLVMLAQVAEDRQSASVVSVPGNSQVAIPGRGTNRLNEAYAAGGATLLVQTVEELSDVHVDHFVVLDFADFRAVVDAVDGIDVTVAEATANRGVQFRKGVNHLDGAEALAYVQQRIGLPGDDLDRAQRQLNVMRALLTEVTASASVTDPMGAYAVVDAVSRSASVDDTLTNDKLRQLVMDLAGLRPANVTFLAAPVNSMAVAGGEPLISLDEARAAELWAALREGSAASYAQKNPADVLGSVPS